MSELENKAPSKPPKAPSVPKKAPKPPVKPAAAGSVPAAPTKAPAAPTKPEKKAPIKKEESQASAPETEKNVAPKKPAAKPAPAKAAMKPATANQEEKKAAPKKPEQKNDASAVLENDAQKPEPVEDKTENKPSAPEKPAKKAKKANVDDKNLKVVESALSVEELNQRKQRKIRNSIYAMSAVVLVLIIALIVILLWPSEERVEAQYDLTFESVPANVSIEHAIFDSEINGNVITFKKPITIQNAKTSSYNGFTNFIMKVKFVNSNKVDVTNQIYLRINDDNREDVYLINGGGSITVGDVDDLRHSYVDLKDNEYIYYTNILTKADDPYEVILGFMVKDQRVLEDEITMQVTFYCFDSSNLNLSITSSGSYLISSGTNIPANDEYVNKVKENANSKN